MRKRPNDIVQGLIRHLPKVIGSIDMRSVDNRTYNAVRLTRKFLKRLEVIENKALQEVEMQE